MSDSSKKRAEDFLKISSQFHLGSLLTESSHPITSNLSQTAAESITSALKLLFEVDQDVLRVYRQFANSGRALAIASCVRAALEKGGRIFFSGCGSTGRLSIQLVSIWRAFWQQQRARNLASSPPPEHFEQQALSVMAGGDFALIKAVEGFEDFARFGEKQIADLGISTNDVLFAITEGGETSFVIGTAWKGVESGATVYFVYNNPDEALCATVQRSREIINEQRIEKINLTTGSMAITGSTRMQATSIQLCVLLTVLEMVLRDLMHDLEPGGPCDLSVDDVSATFLAALEKTHESLTSDSLLGQLSKLVSLEEKIYRSGHKVNYYADRFAIDVLTDTTERSPTYCIPPFRKFDDPDAADSWAFLFVPHENTEDAWETLLKRRPECITWNEADLRALVDEKGFSRTREVLRGIGYKELMRLRIGLDGTQFRPLEAQDAALVVISSDEKALLGSPQEFYHRQLKHGYKSGAETAVVAIGGKTDLEEIQRSISAIAANSQVVLLAVPQTDLLLDGVTRVGLKLLLNALSTCTMVRLGRVMGNFMIWVVPSNLKLIDRSTRYIQKLTNLDYRSANHLLFEVIEYIEPRMKAGQSYPAPVAMAVLRARNNISNEQAEQQLDNQSPGSRRGNEAEALQPKS